MLGKTFGKKSKNPKHDLHRLQREYRNHYMEQLDGLTDEDLEAADDEYTRYGHEAVTAGKGEEFPEFYVTGYEGGMNDIHS
ncbi:MAG: hypothetical protein K6E54_03905 [Bacteroidaceae bacterium]|jgi:hypothetical protein|nr:hypothetical protein [Bacteroidaceae bacterium]